MNGETSDTQFFPIRLKALWAFNDGPIIGPSKVNYMLGHCPIPASISTNQRTKGPTWPIFTTFVIPLHMSKREKFSFKKKNKLNAHVASTYIF